MHVQHIIIVSKTYRETYHWLIGCRVGWLVGWLAESLCTGSYAGGDSHKDGARTLL